MTTSKKVVDCNGNELNQYDDVMYDDKEAFVHFGSGQNIEIHFFDGDGYLEYYEIDFNKVQKIK